MSKKPKEQIKYDPKMSVNRRFEKLRRTMLSKAQIGTEAVYVIILLGCLVLCAAAAFYKKPDMLYGAGMPVVICASFMSMFRTFNLDPQNVASLMLTSDAPKGCYVTSIPLIAMPVTVKQVYAYNVRQYNIFTVLPTAVLSTFALVYSLVFDNMYNSPAALLIAIMLMEVIVISYACASVTKRTRAKGVIATVSLCIMYILCVFAGAIGDIVKKDAAFPIDIFAYAVYAVTVVLILAKQRRNLKMLEGKPWDFDIKKQSGFFGEVLKLVSFCGEWKIMIAAPLLGAAVSLLTRYIMIRSMTDLLIIWILCSTAETYVAKKYKVLISGPFKAKFLPPAILLISDVLFAEYAVAALPTTLVFCTKQHLLIRSLSLLAAFVFTQIFHMIITGDISSSGNAMANSYKGSVLICFSVGVFVGLEGLLEFIFEKNIPNRYYVIIILVMLALSAVLRALGSSVVYKRMRVCGRKVRKKKQVREKELSYV